jgi:muramoyltetrapeptide carboxypeptidase LdcA involved in peptidoglycan recycling
MVKNHFTRKQKRVLKRICETQIESLTRIYRDKAYSKDLKDLKEMGFEVSSSDYDVILTRKIKNFLKAKRRLNDLYKVLDDRDIKAVKDILYFEDQQRQVVRNIWRKLNLSDSVVSSSREITIPIELLFNSKPFNFNFSQN